ncbi:MAG TPA: DNA gyrase modulator, partial [Candidatus Deferrimicrobium sp.]|nr:DNA gyrase modulator [Candidatus Deferrimicrobium sp.]
MSSELPSREELLDIADGVLARVPEGSDAEVIVTETATALTRYANGGIHQNVADRTLSVRLRLVRDGRSGVAQTQVTGDDAVPALVEAAENIRAHSPHGEPVYPVAPDGGEDTEKGYSAATESMSPEERADTVGVVCAAAAGQGQKAYGSCESTVTAVAMASTTGLRRASRQSVAELIAVCRGDDGNAYAARYG